MSEAAPSAETPLFDPGNPAFRENPYPHYHAIRETARFYQPMEGLWIATRYNDIVAILRDRRFGHNYRQELIDGGQNPDEPVFRNIGSTMLVLDPPDHTRLRGLVAKAFTAKRVEAMRSDIQAIVDRLIDAVADAGHMDIIKDFAFPLPFTVICEMLGVPEADRERLMERNLVAGRAIDPTPLTPEELATANQTVEANHEYFRGLCEERRRNPRDDLITALVEAEEAGDKLSPYELLTNISLLFAAGHETTVNLIGNGLLALHRNPDQLALLKDEPGLAKNAVEELLRYDSSVQLTGRTAKEDVEIDGTLIREADVVITLLGAGNHDPEIFDDPDRLDIRRENIRPLSFGGGIHHCLGAQLARLEGEIAIGTFVNRLPGLELDDPWNVEWRPTFTLRGLVSLPAHW